MNGFVYVQQIASVEELKNLLEKLWIDPSYYFVRSPNSVSGITMQLPTDISHQGQMFNHKWELRWKKQPPGYEVLLLSIAEIDSNLGFQAVSNDWKICDRHAYFYDNDETKFPKGFVYIGENNTQISPKTIPINQRYFKDAKTETVHFVALTIK